MTTYNIAGLGELLWDVLPGGEVLGGAPANFCYHINSLGGRGVPISAVGADDRGIRALKVLQKKGVETDGITSIPDKPTGWVDAMVDGRGVATYSFPDDVAWDHLSLNAFSLSLQSSLHAVCFGTLAQRGAESRQAIYEYLDGLTASQAVRVFDINLRQNFYSQDILLESLKRTDILKLNDDELKVIRKLFTMTGSDVDVLSEIRKKYNLSMIILTRGGMGSVLLTAEKVSEQPGIETTMQDTIGAGDSFTAAATIGYLQGRDLDEINELASRLAAYVCTQKGAMPDVPGLFKMT